ncbi:MAG: CpsB/CapC family capsule biosynthesis tyrosine phosphatase [Deltaproteobacteria bacterium]
MRSTREFFDIHTHILQGVDDGAADIGESLAIIREAAEAGVRGIVLTPHFPYAGMNLELVAGRFKELRDMVSAKNIDMTISLGAELRFSHDLPEILSDRRLTINCAGKYALVEMPAYEIPMYAHDVFFKLMTMGITPVWGHPERCDDVIRDYTVVKDFVDRGALVQINAGSLIGDYGGKVKGAVKSLVKNNLAHILASDTHRAGSIKDRLPEAFNRIEKLAGYQTAVELSFSNPSKLVS